jgi:DNA-binding response OmpR family regulator
MVLFFTREESGLGPVRDGLKKEGYAVRSTCQSDEVIAMMAGGAYRLLLIEVGVLGVALEVVEKVRLKDPAVSVLVMAEIVGYEEVRRSMRLRIADIFNPEKDSLEAVLARAHSLLPPPVLSPEVVSELKIEVERVSAEKEALADKLDSLNEEFLIWKRCSSAAEAVGTTEVMREIDAEWASIQATRSALQEEEQSLVKEREALEAERAALAVRSTALEAEAARLVAEQEALAAQREMVETMLREAFEQLGEAKGAVGALPAGAWR